MSPLRRFVTERRFVMQKRLMKDYVTHVLNRNDVNIEMLLQDNDLSMESGGLLNFAEMNVTLNTLATSMEVIANQLFATGFHRYHVAALFMYSIKLDEYLKNNYEQNYDTNLLANSIVNILLNIGYEVPTQSYCTIL